MAFAAQTQRLQTKNQLLGREGVQRRAQVTQNFNTRADSKGDGTKGLPELESVVAFGGFNELREASGILAPVKLAAVDNYTTDSCTMAADPLSGAFNDDVSAVVDGAGEVATGTEGVVNLATERRVSHFAGDSFGLANNLI